VRHARTTTLGFVLEPAFGSVYLSFADIASHIDSVIACVYLDTPRDTICDRDNTTGQRVYLCLDYIPDSAQGRLRVFGKDGAQIVYDTTIVPFSFSAGDDETNRIVWGQARGSLRITTAVSRPGVHMIAGFMDSSRQDFPTHETGPVYISEVVAVPNGNEFIEVHNPTGTDITYDSLIVDCYASTVVETVLHGVTVAAGARFVIGADAVTDPDVRFQALSALVSTYGYLSIKSDDTTTVDWLVYSSDAGDGWPNAGSGESLVYDTLAQGTAEAHLYNNYGKYWYDADTVTPGS
jgi:hypothetical protein